MSLILQNEQLISSFPQVRYGPKTSDAEEQNCKVGISMTTEDYIGQFSIKT